MTRLTTVSTLAMAAAMSVTASADNLTGLLQNTTEKAPTINKTSRIIRQAPAPQRAPGLRLPGNGIATKSPNQRHKISRADQEVMFESFEYDDQPYLWREETADLGWLPEGWSRISDSAVDAPIDKWFAHPFEAVTMTPCYEGNYVMAVLFNSEYKDEWLVTPDITIEPDQYLTFGWYYVPAYFWVIDSKHVDFENMVFTNREIAVTMKVMISVEGADWTEIKDLSEEFADWGFEDLLSYYPAEMMDAKISLADYAGKSVKIAFRYVGTDGNSMFIDGVSINNGTVRLDAIYQPPLPTQYVGGAIDGEILDVPAQIHPVCTPLEWTNRSANGPTATYTWDLAGLPVTSEGEQGFALEFPIPAATTRLPFTPYLPPILTASAPGSRSTDYMEDAILMAGGKSQVGDTIYGVLPFDLYSSGVGTHTAEPVDFGHRRIPIFGYSEDTDAWWRLYTCGGDEENLDHIPYAYVSGIINGIMVGEKPLVVKRAWLYAIGKVDDSARFRCSIYSLTEDGAFDRELATSSIKGSDLMILDTRTSLYYYSLPFDFGKSIVLDAEGTEGGLYAVVVTGFHDGGVEYFAPVMQQVPDRFENCFGFYQIEYMYQDVHTVGLSFVAFHENEYGPMYNSFAINLDAEYPWLESDVTEVDLTDEATVALRSYYGGSDLKVTLADGSELPDWLSANVRGRFDNTVLTLRAYGDERQLAQDIVVKGPGVAKTLKVNSAGISDITADGDAPAIYYNLSGIRVTNPVKGQTLIRVKGGKASVVSGF